MATNYFRRQYPFVSRFCNLSRHLPNSVTKEIATVSEKPLKICPLVVRIRPTAAGPLLGAKMQRYLGKDPLLKVNSMIAVFCGRQYQFRFTDVAGIDI
jgi:hypothetical protein